MASASTAKFEAIQVLRAIAALAVLIYHVRGYAMITANYQSPILEVFRSFDVGVNIFFAISGFLMAHLISHGYPAFLLRRAARIYPTYVVAVGLVVIARVSLLGGYNQNDMLLAMTLIPGAGHDYPLNIEWTLVYEMYFYVVCSIFALPRLRGLFPAFLVAWLIFLAVASVLHVVDRDPLPSIASIPFQSISAPFVTGAIAYYLRDAVRMPKAVTVAMLITGLLAAGFVDPISMGLPAAAADFLYGGLFGVLMVAASQLQIDASARLTRTALWLGDRSYGIYLVHAMTLLIAYLLILRTGLGLGLTGCLVAGTAALLAGFGMGELDVRIHGYVSAYLKRLRLRSKAAHQTLAAPAE